MQIDLMPNDLFPKTKAHSRNKNVLRTKGAPVAASSQKLDQAAGANAKKNVVRGSATLSSVRSSKITKNNNQQAEAMGNVDILPRPLRIHPQTASLKPIPVGEGSRVTATSRPQDALNSSCQIFQIYYEPWHLELLDPAFVPFNNCGVKSEFMEFDVFERIFSAAETRTVGLWGALSWRFSEKTGMSGKEFVAEIEANPGYDFYYCNPYPHNESLFHNMWLQGETAHPRFLDISKAVFEASGVNAAHLSSIQHSSFYSAANYFIATDAFWKVYIPFVRRIIGLAEAKMSSSMQQLMHSSEADPRSMHAGANYISFIIERLFPLFMQTAGRKLKGHKVALPKREADMNIHLRLLREMKDVAHQTKSSWLAACWVNYRNLYLGQTNGHDWCSKHLRNITPPSINFS